MVLILNVEVAYALQWTYSGLLSQDNNASSFRG